MQNQCRDCQHLTESALTTEPHSQLKPLIRRPSAQVYHCDLCNSCFIYTDTDISLILLDNDEKKQLQAAYA